VWIQNLVKVVPIVLAGGTNAPDEAMFVIHTYAELVAKVALAMFLGVGGVGVFVVALSVTPVRLLA
jgi:hypothetical protein